MPIFARLFIEMSRLNFAWELLRENFTYIAEYYAHLRNREQETDCYCTGAHKWGLLKLH